MSFTSKISKGFSDKIDSHLDLLYHISVNIIKANFQPKMLNLLTKQRVSSSQMTLTSGNDDINNRHNLVILFSFSTSHYTKMISRPLLQLSTLV